MSNDDIEIRGKRNAFSSPSAPPIACLGTVEVPIARTEIRIKGAPVSVPSAQIDGRTVIVTGKCLKKAVLHDEEVVEDEPVPDPESFVAQLKGSALGADIFTFRQKLADAHPRYPYRLEWDSFAVIPLTTYSDWLQKLAKYDVRTAVKKATRLGIVTREVEVDDNLIEGIVRIYNESPIRQGRPFWHYQKDFTTVKNMSSTYLDRSIFVGAYYNDELVGFIKMVTVERAVHTFHVISMIKHFDKKPTNALIAKAVEICAGRGMSHLVYGNFVYSDTNSSLTEFKRRNGFQEVLVPRYYVPLTRIGEVALTAKLHHGLGEMLPQPVRKALLKGRASLSKLLRL